MDLREIGWHALNWTHLSQDVDQQRSFVNTVMNAGFEVLTAVVMTITIIWDITPCTPFKVILRFGGIYRLHIQGGITEQNTRVKADGKQLLSHWYLTRFIWPWRWRRYVPPKRRLIFSGLYAVISNKIVLDGNKLSGSMKCWEFHLKENSTAWGPLVNNWCQILYI
jgi:hypothetical protein